MQACSVEMTVTPKFMFGLAVYGPKEWVVSRYSIFPARLKIHKAAIGSSYPLAR